jgi:uncharacterized protein YqgV (UPF0045/DUF77 family)
MKSALAIQCLPLAVAEKGKVHELVDGAIKAIEVSGLSYTVGPFETVVEGPLEDLWKVAQCAHDAIAGGCGSGVATYMKMFTAPDLSSTDEKLGKYRPFDR